MWTFRKIGKIVVISILVKLLITCLFIFAFMKNDGYKVALLMNKIIPQGGPYYDTHDLSWCKAFRAHTVDIRREYYNYINSGKKLPSLKEVDQAQENVDVSEIPWKVVVLRAFNKDTQNMQFFPHLKKYLEIVPNCSFAMFSILPPGKSIPMHTGAYRGVLRYHLAIQTAPKGQEDGCKIIVNNIPYSWVAGEDVLFDDSYAHKVVNNTKYTRVVLFLDIEKPLSGYKKYLNKLFLYLSQYNVTIEQLVNKVNDFAA